MEESAHGHAQRPHGTGFHWPGAGPSRTPAVKTRAVNLEKP